MSYKYIPQENNENFVFPNYDLAEYDVDIIHTINNNSVSGTVTNFTAVLQTSSQISFTHNYTWSGNGAERYVFGNQIHLLSVHMLAAGQNYYKPWREVDIVRSATTGSTTYSGSNTILVQPSQMGLTTFTSGTYYFEIRFIGANSIYPVCITQSLTIT